MKCYHKPQCHRRVQYVPFAHFITTSGRRLTTRLNGVYSCKRHATSTIPIPPEISRDALSEALRLYGECLKESPTSAHWGEVDFAQVNECAR